MSRDELTLKKPARIPYSQGTNGNAIGSRPIMTETDCDVVHCPTVGTKHWMIDPRLVDEELEIGFNVHIQRKLL